MSSIEVTGDLEVTVTLAEPYAPFLAALANTPAAVLPIAEIEAGEVDITTEMLGTGPLVATAHRQDGMDLRAQRASPRRRRAGFQRSLDRHRR